jgi:hypothetical protein
LQKHLEALLADRAHQGGKFLVGRRQLQGRDAGPDGPQLRHAVSSRIAMAMQERGWILRTQDAAGILVGEEEFAVLQRFVRA